MQSKILEKRLFESMIKRLCRPVKDQGSGVVANRSFFSTQRVQRGLSKCSLFLYYSKYICSTCSTRIAVDRAAYTMRS